ncbi:hypothetical protein LTR17_018774 [Elasticomyces elasticus]|nr:hypothetical protein LTR17_018774 [Elasticomyces elasticus]
MSANGDAEMADSQEDSERQSQNSNAPPPPSPPPAATQSDGDSPLESSIHASQSDDEDYTKTDQQRRDDWPEIDFDEAGTATRYLLQLKERGNHALLQEILKDDIRQPASANGSPLILAPGRNIHIRAKATEMLHFMPEALKIGLISGQLKQNLSMMPPTTVSQIMPSPISANNDPKIRPVIYGWFHTKKRNGSPPSKTDYLALLAGLVKYIVHARAYFGQGTRSGNADVGFVAKVDRWKKGGVPTWMDGGAAETRNRLDGARRYFKSKSNIDNAEQWAAELRSRLDLIPQGMEDEPLPWAISEVGWTFTPPKRRSAHEGHSYGSMNALMSLVEALGAITIDEPAGTLGTLDEHRMHWHILFQVFDRDQVELSEHLVSRLAHSYHFLGGLNVVIGGASIASADKITDVEWAAARKNAIAGRRLKHAIDQYEDDKTKMKKEWDEIETIVRVRGVQADREAAKGDVVTSGKNLSEESTRLRQSDKEMEGTMRQFFNMEHRNVTSNKAAEELSGEMREAMDLLKKLQAMRL